MNLARTLRRFTLFVALAASWAARASAQTAWGESPDGTTVTQLAPATAKAVVLYFVASDCPISNRTFPEMRRLRESYQSKNVVFWYVYPNSTETKTDVIEHQKEYDPKGLALIARGPAIVRLGRAYATPEIAVLTPNGHGGWTARYAGRVDNRYVKFGLERPRATAHYGQDAIDAVLAGRNPLPDTGKIVGCAILNPGARP